MNSIDKKYSEEIAKLKQEVYDANMLLVKYNLVIHTWGNVSGITKDRKYMVIKPKWRRLCDIKARRYGYYRYGKQCLWFEI